MNRLLIVLPFVFFACASPPPAAPPPRIDVVPVAALDAFCARLQMDAIASGAPISIVSTTQPLATQQSVSSLRLVARGRNKPSNVAQSAADANRALPVSTEGSTCRWRPVAVADIDRHYDEMLVELSAPAANPFSPREAGLFARVTVGGEGAAWYWIAMVPYGERWRVAGVSVLVQ